MNVRGSVINVVPNVRVTLDLPAGFVIADRYTVVRFLGRGAFGTVYECTDSMLADLAVAVKIYLRSISIVNPKKYTPRVHREMLLCQKVSHSNVAAFYDCIQTEKLVGYSMELVDGSSFEEVIEKGRTLKTTELIRFFKQLVRGLSAIHNAGVIHRDIKPSNILLTHLKEVKISDFGIANQRSLEQGIVPDATQENSGASARPSLACSHAGRLVGTPLYLAPEYISRGLYDERSDLYACGAMWYEVLTGSPAHNHKELPELLIKKVQEEPCPPKEINAACSEDLSAIVMKLIAKNPDERYQSADEVERALFKFEQKIEKVRRHAVGAQSDINLRGGLFVVKESHVPNLAERNETHRTQPRSSTVPSLSYLPNKKKEGFNSKLEQLWELLFEQAIIVPLMVGLILVSVLMLAVRSWNSSSVKSPTISPQVTPQSNYHTPLNSKSEILRTTEDAKRVRLNEPTTTTSK